MKNKSTELDVDFIGGQGPLTKEEEQAISEFLKAQQWLRMNQQSHKRPKQNQEQKFFRKTNDHALRKSWEYPLKCVNQKSCSENFLTPSGIGQKKFSETTFRKFNTHKYEKRRFT